VFFYREGVHNASALASPPRDEHSLPLAWQQLAQEYQLDLVVCVAAALRRGILDENSRRPTWRAVSSCPVWGS
jgi:tRNA 2-thiouridine synthesizing protein D